MKKTQFALAALALVASTAAFADGVTVYGTVDASVGKTTNGKTAIDGTGNWNGSIFGFKGSEDLEGGMKAFFNLEMGLNVANGTQNNGGTSPTQGTVAAGNQSVFNRLANVGLSSEMGSVTVGLQLNQFVAGALGTLLNANESLYVPMLLVAGGGTGALFGGGGTSGTNGGFFQSNLITYSSPSIGGFSTSLQTQLQGNSNQGVATGNSDSMNAASASYSAGPVNVTAAYLNRKDTTTASTVGGSYNLGEATLNARYFTYSDDATAGSAKVNTYQVGASYALSGNTSASVNYVKNNQANAQSIVNVGLQHNLSKSTYLYATASQAKNGALALYSQLTDGGAGGATSTTGYALGVVKSF
jgi:predicted porin